MRYTAATPLYLAVRARACCAAEAGAQRWATRTFSTHGQSDQLQTMDTAEHVHGGHALAGRSSCDGRKALTTPSLVSM